MMLFYSAVQDQSGTDFVAYSTPKCWSCRRCQPLFPSSTRLFMTCCAASSFFELAVRTRSLFQMWRTSFTNLALKVRGASVMPGGLKALRACSDSSEPLYHLQVFHPSCLRPGWAVCKRTFLKTFCASSALSMTCWHCLRSWSCCLAGAVSSSPSGNASSRPGMTSQTYVRRKRNQLYVQITK